MKKVMSLLFLSVLLLSLVAAAQNNSGQGNQGIGQELSQQIRERKAEIKSGDYNLSLGQMLQVREMVQGLKELRTDSRTAKTELNITAEIDENNKTKLRTRLRNGSETEIKIMPDTAANRAIERLKLRVCSEENNCTLELKETGTGSKTRASYEVQVERHYRLLALFKAKAVNKAEVDAGTGEVTVTKKPWWAFLATKQD